MDIRNQQGDHVAKQKNTQKSNSRKEMQAQIQRLEGAMGKVFNELDYMNRHFIGMENLFMSFADFLGKRKDFETHIQKVIEESKKEKPEIVNAEKIKAKI